MQRLSHLDAEVSTAAQISFRVPSNRRSRRKENGRLGRRVSGQRKPVPPRLRRHPASLNNLLRGRVSRFSLDALVNIATVLGGRVHVELDVA